MEYASTVDQLNKDMPKAEFLVLYDGEVSYPDPYGEIKGGVTTNFLRAVSCANEAELIKWIEQNRLQTKYKVLKFEEVDVYVSTVITVGVK